MNGTRFLVLKTMWIKTLTSVEAIRGLSWGKPPAVQILLHRSDAWLWHRLLAAVDPQWRYDQARSKKSGAMPALASDRSAMREARMDSPAPKQGVVLSSGGADGAYAVGVLKALLSGRSLVTGYLPLDPVAFV